MLARSRRSGKTDRLQPMDERGEGVDLGVSPNSDKPEKPLRFDSASSCLLSECALKVFSRRNPSKLNTRVRFPSPAPKANVALGRLRRPRLDLV
jgi:hypothetical protein